MSQARLPLQRCRPHLLLDSKRQTLFKTCKHLPTRARLIWRSYAMKCPKQRENCS